jgi:hypothetical protein
MEALGNQEYAKDHSQDGLELGSRNVSMAAAKQGQRFLHAAAHLRGGS